MWDIVIRILGVCGEKPVGEGDLGYLPGVSSKQPDVSSGEWGVALRRSSDYCLRTRSIGVGVLT